ncbi:UDP-N-acetylmuramoyl-tripeptide--D-alanyl-D-alanine ligase [Sphingomonas sabuli]|uniref:UDP-N-acetylmuramoyl-tripeptide--D-alanyl-D-alanine ligase n=1 Tax=Sphingomonas sabuli TaxID=2764186 RepID=A0A7G9L1M5_9SPHN|nr:UDP-N-acetylmuramoyl-tripeptide--D-alanyl-D-alanine ligase [Sphingomonas sabuli]QNM82524.1 UDP-N-acetylmuramoyl-tripeptide--D-alanyl-D-alanine ligase [Sphingomonas sabuli]
MSALWTSAEIAAATGGTASADFDVSGVTFDSREVGGGDLFVAMPGTVHDGHDFLDQAIASGAAGLLVSKPCDHPHVLVDDVARALEALGKAARARSGATIIGVTGSVGKTSTKEALYAALDRWQPGAVHRSVKSYNNHTGVPLSLARLPREAKFAVLEMGMNNKGEIATLTRFVRPHVALITTIAPAHIENLGSEEAIADAKAEIFEGLEPEGIAVIPNDSPHRDRLVRAARRHAERIVTFGTGDADVHALHAVRAERGGSLITAALLDSDITFTISQRGEHWVWNALAVLTAVEAVGGDLALAGLALADLGGLKGRGERHRILLDGGEALVIDESYNANPASMAATLKSFGAEGGIDRRIAVLGPMRELGDHARQLHADLAPAVLDARVEELVLVGDDMRPLEDALGDSIHVTRASDADAAADAVERLLRPGDAVLVKASNSIGLAQVVERLTREDA